MPISNIDIERIGSPNKPKGLVQHDVRKKIDDEEEIETKSGSHTIQNIFDPSSESNSMVAFYKNSKMVKADNTPGDMKTIIDDICSSLIGELDQKLFPNRPLFFLTADLSTLSLDQALVLLRDMTPEKERIIVEKIMERQAKNEEKAKKKSKAGTDTSKLVFYEKKGIRTDYVAVESYIKAMHKHIKKYKIVAFMKKLFSPVKHDPFEMLNQLQNSDIGSYEHFQVDMNKLAILTINTYLEMENYWKKQEEYEENNPPSPNLTPSKSSKKRKHRRKRFEFDTTGLTDEQIREKKQIFRECEHIHNKAMFDCVNESLVQFRPYGKNGEPAPWSSKRRTLKQGPEQPKYDIDQIFKKVQNDMFRW